MNKPSRQHFKEGSGMSASLYSFCHLDNMVSDSSASSPSAIVSSGRRGSKKVRRASCHPRPCNERANKSSYVEGTHRLCHLQVRDIFFTVHSFMDMQLTNAFVATGYGKSSAMRPNHSV